MRLSVIAITLSAYCASTIGYPMAPNADFPSIPFILPISSQAGAPINAMSIFTSPDSMALALPPWVLNTTGFPRIFSSA